MTRLTADFSSAFKRDLKKKAAKRNWDLDELEHLIDLVLENTAESMAILKSRHNMHVLSGEWRGRNECHVANAGDLASHLVIQRYGGLFRTYGFARRAVPLTCGVVRRRVDLCLHGARITCRRFRGAAAVAA